MKKSQVQQMFYYILALFIIGSMLLLGVKYIYKITSEIETIDLLEFKTGIQTDVDEMSSKYGSWEKRTYPVPKGAEKVCFFTIGKYKETCANELDFVVCDAWESGSSNVMTLPFVLDTPINLSKMEVKDDKGYKCFEVIDRKITLKLTGKGNGVIISEP